MVTRNVDTEEEWLTWALRAFQSIYGYEYQGDNLLIARVNMVMSFEEHLEEAWHRKPTVQEYKDIIRVVVWNIWQMDGLTKTVPDGALGEVDEQTNIFELLGLEPVKEKSNPCRVFNWRGQRSYPYQSLPVGGNNPMKFDFIIGNPPYQDETLGNNKGYAPPIYHLFMNEAYRVADKAELVHPARFLFNAGSTPKGWNEKMLQDKHFKVLYYEPDSGRLFPGTSINGGIVISYYDTTTSFGPIEAFTHFDELNHIRQKVCEHDDFTSFRDIVFSAYSYHLSPELYHEHPELKSRPSKGHEYDLKSNVLELMPEVFLDEKEDNDDIQILGRKANARAIAWIKRKYITGPENLDCYKIFLAKADGAAGSVGKPIPARIIGVPSFGTRGAGATESFISIGAFETEEIANSALKYIKSKFARALLGVMKVTQDITPEKWKYVPLQDFTSDSDIDWTKSVPEIDHQLYAKYGLDETEIAFIESHVKEME